MIESNYFALQVSSKLGNGRDADVYSPFFAKGAVATSLLLHAAHTAYFMEDKKKASEYYETAVAKVLRDFSFTGELASQKEILAMPVSQNDISLIMQHYDYQTKLDNNGRGELNASFKFKIVETPIEESLIMRTPLLVPTELAGVNFSCINLHSGLILYEQPNESSYEYWSDGFITKQDNEIFRDLIEFLENTLN